MIAEVDKSAVVRVEAAATFGKGAEMVYVKAIKDIGKLPVKLMSAEVSVVGNWSPPAQFTIAEFPDLVNLAAEVVADRCPPELLADALDEVQFPAGHIDATCRGLAALLLRRAGGVAQVERVAVKAWNTGVIEITDLTNAGKRGKTCERVRVYGTDLEFDAAAKSDAGGWTRAMVRWARGLNATRPYADVVSELRAHVDLFRSETGGRFEVKFEWLTVKGVDAPRPKLTAGVSGVWAARSDEHGTWVERLDDTNNWTQASRGKSGAAYDKAAKVWDKVKAAKTFAEVVALFEAAGLDLRGYCGMD